MKISDGDRSRVAAAAVFTGSFLLFLIQPVTGRTLLPVFGGAASVWLLCLAAWQTLLLAGYFYAHYLRNHAGRVKFHLSLLLSASICVLLATALREPIFNLVRTQSDEITGVLLCILIFAAFPYVLLAAGASLVQSWIISQRRSANDGVYHLYAVSNAGSFCGLFCYPFLVEPFIPLSWQWYGFVALMLVYAALLKAVASEKSCSVAGRDDHRRQQPAKDVSCVSWFAFPALSCFLLNAVIASMFVDVTPLPMIWIFFLGCFLLSYVVGFSPFAAKSSRLWFILALLSVAAAIAGRRAVGAGSLLINGVSAAAVIFFFGSWLHHRLYLERPETDRLTHYYLIMTAGGAVGGVLASVVAPLVFDSVFEYPLALWFSACMLLALTLRPLPFFKRHRHAYGVTLCLWALGVALCVYRCSRRSEAEVILSRRNFYGILRVTRTREAIGENRTVPVNYLWSGQTTHGIQIKHNELRRLPNSYYGTTGGGIAVLAHPRYRKGQPLTVGIIGLGAGSMATYGRVNDLYRFFEINPDVIDVACNPTLFSFLADSSATIDLIEGDARRMLAIEQQSDDPLYDVLMIDAYSGDAVPGHLATREAYELYFNRLKSDGILAVHVSNWHIDLLPLCKAAARVCDAELYGVVGIQENAHTTRSIWVFMTAAPFKWNYPLRAKVKEIDWPLVPDMKMPEDDCGSLISLIRWL